MVAGKAPGTWPASRQIRLLEDCPMTEQRQVSRSCHPQQLCGPLSGLMGKLECSGWPWEKTELWVCVSAHLLRANPNKSG